MPGRQLITREEKLRGFGNLLMEDPAKAAEGLSRYLRDDPLDADAYRLLAKAKAVLHDSSAQSGNLLSSSVSGANARLAQAARAIQSDDLPTAEVILRARLLDDPSNVHALRMMADIAYRVDLRTEAEQLLRYALELAPDFHEMKLDLARQLYLTARYSEALDLIGGAIAADPDNEGALYMKGVVLGHAGRFEEAVAVYEGLVERSPGKARLWAGLGRSLKTIGRSAEGIDAFRRATVIDPTLGEAWWSLSDLKTVKFDDSDIARMEEVLSGELADKDRYYLHFALGKAFEQRRDHGRSFHHYAEGNRLHGQQLDYDASRLGDYVTAAGRMFSKEFFESRQDVGDPGRDPIFILGMSRSGSTLIEQILASHPAIEGTMELPNVAAIAAELGDTLVERLDVIATLDGGRFAEMGARYIRDTRAYRKTDRPFFIDKMPNNWVYVPLIHLMLPNARIIDARRHPLACCWSNYKQNYARGQSFSYDLGDIGAYYSDYVRMMAQVDAALPGKVHRLFYEDMVDDTEGEIRRLLDYLGLPFHENCLRFHENNRAVRTASAEQVRRPINREGIDQWRDYEPWLGPLKQALGPVLTAYPDVPSFSN